MKTLLCLILCLLPLVVMGCVTHPPAAVAVHHPLVSTAVPPSLKSTAINLDWIIAISVILLGVGIGLYAWLPSHNISLPIMAIAGGVEASALVARVSLWFVPWLAGGLAVTAILVFVYEVYIHRTTPPISTGVDLFKKAATAAEAEIKKL